MNWNNLQENKCPKCSGYMYASGDFTICPFCKFRIRTAKLSSLIGGKESKAYVSVVQMRKGLKKKAIKEKKRALVAVNLQTKEKVSNLARMLSRGEIQQAEYDTKMKALT